MIFQGINVSGSVNVTGSFKVPTGDTLPLTSSALIGDLFFDTTNDALKIRTSEGWEDASSATTPVTGVDIDYLVIAGGGGGGGRHAGGGGAGGYLTSTLTSISSGSSITVTIGAGGPGSPDGSTTGIKSGSTGNDSSIVSAGGTSFTSVTTAGGGFGGGDPEAGSSYTQGIGGDGGSGGGSSYTGTGGSGTTGQGNDGGIGQGSPNYGGGGGGGASTVGTNASGTQSGAGGTGLASSITGTSVTRAGGGGAGGWSGVTAGAGGTGGGGGGIGGASNTNATAGTANTGGGGGGGGGETSAGGTGGSGITILSYPSASFNGAGGIVGDAGNGSKYHQFNSTGTFEIGSSTDFTLPASDNLQLLWRADDFNSRGSSTWTDISGNNRNGTVSGATLGDNFFYTFDGSNDYIEDSNYYRPSGAQTLAIWMNFAGDGVAGYSLSGWQQSGAYNYVGGKNNGNLYYYMGASTGGEVSYALSNSTWYLLTNTVTSGGNHNVYVDTTSRVSNSSISMGNAGSSSFRIGAVNSSHYHNGDIGMAMVWDTHLTSTQISELYNATKTNFV